MALTHSHHSFSPIAHLAGADSFSFLLSPERSMTGRPDALKPSW